MKPTWILVADSSQARIFSADTALTVLEEIECLIHTDGHLHDRDLTSDLPGKIRSQGGSIGHAFEQPTDPKQHEAASFAQHIVEYLEQANHASRYERLMLIAAPAFLGLLRHQLSAQTQKRVYFELDKNLTTLNVDAIRKHLPHGLR